MDNAIYVSLSRQSGLMKEMSVIANNMANVNTTGFKRESAVFTEFVQSVSQKTLRGDDATSSLSMGRLGGHVSHFDPGAFQKTGGDLDLAIDGEGFFLIETPIGEALTRAGQFMMDADGGLVTSQGQFVLDAGGGRIQIPLEAKNLTVGNDGTLSADGQELGQLAIVTADPTTLQRRGDNLWTAIQGNVALENPRVIQGFVEGSNVKAVSEIARMIEVQRHYDAGQKILDLENDRIKGVISTVRQLT